MTIWRTSNGEYAVCSGHGPADVAGYILCNAPDAWSIKDDPHNRRFLDGQTAAAAVLDIQLRQELLSYSITRSDEDRLVLALPEDIARLREDGWHVITSDIPRDA